MSESGGWSRRGGLQGAGFAPPVSVGTFVREALGAVGSQTATPRAADQSVAHGQPDRAVTPFPLEAVRLRPSPYMAAVESNRVYLLRLEPDRLLHNFRVSAGLPPKGDVYGGWEAMS